MLSEYGKAVVEERTASRDAALARYLRWEHGDGTEVAALSAMQNGSAASRQHGSRSRPSLARRILARARLVRA